MSFQQWKNSLIQGFLLQILTKYKTTLLINLKNMVLIVCCLLGGQVQDEARGHWGRREGDGEEEEGGGHHEQSGTTQLL